VLWVLPWKMSRLSAGPDTDPVRANGSKVAVMERSPRSPGEVVSDDGELRVTRLGDEPWLVVAGEIDEYSYTSLIRALASVARVPGAIHIDLADVQYCDVAGLRAFVVLAAAPHRDHGGARVVLHKVPSHLVNVLHILGWDATSGLAIAEGPADPPTC
jgi:ABC-type transporter Mla MlaB component